MTPPSIAWTIEKLATYHGDPPRKPVLDPVDELVQTVLSQNTSDVNSLRAFKNLKARFPSWEEVLSADERELADSIRSGGLADIKAPRLKSILSTLIHKRGSLDLGFLRGLPLDEAKAWLQGLPGVGPKTAACVLLFSLGRPALPVDTHVLRLAKRLGLVLKAASAGKAQGVLERMVPAQDVYSFHLLLIQHGRLVCRARRPLCAICVLNGRCPSAFSFD